jgi:uncharacterized phiE125 gp8 family phage protein
MMTPVLLAGPAVEPVSVTDLKSYLKVETGDEDSLIAALIAAARLTVEAVVGRILVDQSWRVVLDCWPREATLRLPVTPLRSCSAIRVYDAAGLATVLDPADYQVDAQSEPGRIRLLAAPPAPGRALSGIEIDIVAGYGAAAADPPEALRLAVKRLAAHWFEHRGEADGIGEAPVVPPDIAALLAPFRRGRI